MTPLLADENVRFAIVAALRNFGYDVVTAYEAGLANKKTPDEDVLAHAIADGRAVLTNNRKHYHRLHKNTPGHTGIITYTRDPDDLAVARRIHDGMAGSEPLGGKLVKIIRPP